MKYEMIFGDEALFDGMIGDCEFASEEYGYIFANGALCYCERYNEKAGYRDWETDRKSTRLNSSHITRSRMPSSA